MIDLASSTASNPVPVALHGDFKPLPTQLAFTSSPHRIKAYIGAMGSGKTRILCHTALDFLTRLPGSRGVIGRYTLKDFKRTTLETLNRILDTVPEVVERQLPSGEGWDLRTTDRDRPSRLWTAHYDESGAYASMGLGLWVIDEVNGDDLSPSVPEPVFHMLDARLGRDQDPTLKPYGLMGGNPGGHNWPWRLCHSASPNRMEDAWMFTAKPYENAVNLPKDYYQRLERTKGAEWVARYVHGSHEVFEGQVYPELNERDHTVNPFEIPPTWPRVIAMDYGFRNPTCVGFAAVNQDGVIFVYDEHYEGDGKPVSYHASKIKRRLPAMEKAREVAWVADPSIFNDRDTWKNGKVYRISDEYADAGLEEWTPGENDVAAGRNRLKEYLQTGKLKFFQGRCPNIWREMQGLHWRRLRTLQDVNAPEEEADIDNHGCLHGDTLVLTPTGEIPIRELAGTEGNVLSPDGHWVSFRNARLTRRMAQTVRVRFDDGREIRCTPDHRFLTPEGWVQAKDLTGLEVYNIVSQCIRNSKAENTIVGKTDTSALPLRATRAGSCIARCGKQLMEAFLTVGRFITSTTTGQIIRSGISASRLAKSTCLGFTMQVRLRTENAASLGPLLPRLHGTEALLVASGIGSTTRNAPDSFFMDEPQQRASAVGIPSKLSPSQDSARITANRLGAGLKNWTTKYDRVLYAKRNSEPTVIYQPGRVPANAVVAAVLTDEPADVYCLTVPGVSAFVVSSGIVVANCDMLRYLVMSRPDPAVDRKAAKPITQEDRQKQFVSRHLAAALARHHQQFKKDDEDFV